MKNIQSYGLVGCGLFSQPQYHGKYYLDVATAKRRLSSVGRGKMRPKTTANNKRMKRVESPGGSVYRPREQVPSDGQGLAIGASTPQSSFHRQAQAYLDFPINLNAAQANQTQEEPTQANDRVNTTDQIDEVIASFTPKLMEANVAPPDQVPIIKERPVEESHL